MVRTQLERLPAHWLQRFGILLLVIGAISIAQAAGLFPLGRSSFPEAAILVSFGGALVLMPLLERPLFRVMQTMLVAIAILLIIIY